VVAGLISAAVVVTDFWIVWRGNGWYLGPRAILPVVAATAYFLMARGDFASVGLRLRPVQGLRYWLVATLAIATAVGAFIAIGGLAMVLTGRPLPLYATPPEGLLPAFVHMCLLAPLVEEAIYRLGLCTGAVPLLGPRRTIAVSGLTFGALHVLYGNPGPDNLVAGFFLAWAYLKSGSFLVPLVLHSLGNLCALSAHVATWYWLSHA
jgi:membrane protease YdiL (CAAX protease family)